MSTSLLILSYTSVNKCGVIISYFQTQTELWHYVLLSKSLAKTCCWWKEIDVNWKHQEMKALLLFSKTHWEKNDGNRFNKIVFSEMTVEHGIYVYNLNLISTLFNYSMLNSKIFLKNKYFLFTSPSRWPW